jgi:hypothetical protein
MSPKEPGRNDPCPCGSGKKFKSCHGSQKSFSKHGSDSNPTDRLKRVSYKLPVDEMGPPFGYKNFAVVPVFDKSEGGENDTKPVGKPGNYKVTFFLARPEVSLSGVGLSETEGVFGDSSLVITSPEPRSPKSTDHLIVEAHDSGEAPLTFQLWPNKYGRLSRIDIEMQAKNHEAARNRAYKGLLPFLSVLSFEHDIPLEIKKTETFEIKTGGQQLEFRMFFKPVGFNGSKGGAKSIDIRTLMSHYREALNSTSINYSFLCFYRILEAIYAKREKLISEKKVRFEFQRENRLKLEDLQGLSKHMDDYQEFVGKKFGNIFEKELTPLRIRIAHGLVTLQGLFDNTADDVALRDRASHLIPIAQILARIEIQNELSKKEVARV